MRSNNKLCRWSREWKSNLRWSAELTRISKVSERRRPPSPRNQPVKSGGMPSPLSRGTANWIWCYQETGWDLFSHWCQCSYSCTSGNQSSTEPFTLSITITSNGRPSTSSSLWTDHCSLIRPSLDWLEPLKLILWIGMKIHIHYLNLKSSIYSINFQPCFNLITFHNFSN